MASFIQFEQEGPVAKITLNRPDKYNSFVREMALDLQEHLKTCGSNKDIRAVYLTGNGKAFCAGQDLQEAISDNGIELQGIVSEHYNPIVRLLRETPKPIVAAVNGVAAGAGANLALACDVVIAARSASFIQAFSNIGLIPDSGGTFTLPRLIGWQKASAYMMLGGKISAEEAERVGMIYRVVDNEQFEAESMAIAQKLANMPTRGLALTKQLLNESHTNNLDQQLQREDIVQTEAGNTYDYQEGVQAFLEKRKPQFKGE